jgi:hypothetical protein
MLLGQFDSEEERESRRRYYRERSHAERVKNGVTAVKMLRKEGIISDTVAEELEAKVDDNHGISESAFVDNSIYESGCSHSLRGVRSIAIQGNFGYRHSNSIWKLKQC